MTELKPCPFCGGKAQLIRLDVDRDFYVKCLKCRVEQGRLYKSVRTATIAWNRRAGAPSERKKGEWLYYDCEDDKYDNIRCSECKKEFTVDADRWCDIGFIAGDFNYCPNCGADMRGDVDD